MSTTSAPVNAPSVDGRIVKFSAYIVRLAIVWLPLIVYVPVLPVPVPKVTFNVKPVPAPEVCVDTGLIGVDV